MSDRLCRCGHRYTLHEHYRPGTDCGTCGRQVCPGFRRPPWLAKTITRLVAALRDVFTPPRMGPPRFA